MPNRMRWLRSLTGAPKPLIMLGLFQAGSTQAVEKGEILELTAGGSTQWVPMDADFAMAADVAIANEEIKDGDRAGYYEIIVPRPGDVFEYALATADATAIGTSLYWSDAETVTVSAGANVIGRAVGQANYPLKQGHLADDASGDSGTTIRSQAFVQMVFTETASYWVLMQAA